MYVLLIPLTCIGITALSYFELLSTLFGIENWLNIKKVISKDV